MVKITSLSPGRLFLIIFLTVAALYVLHYLSGVLIPFVVAWLLAYMLNPVVHFLQHTCRLRFRLPCVLLTLALAFGLVLLLGLLIVPPMLRECGHLEEVLRRYFEHRAENASIPEGATQFFEQMSRHPDWAPVLQGGNVMGFLKTLIPGVWDLFLSTASAIVSLVASLIAVLYLFFLLLDYERYAKGWIKYIPQHRRAAARTFVADFERYFCGYFRGQFLIALSNCVMFTIGFLLIGFPMPIALGVFIGVISFVPYLQVVGMLPAIVFALLRAADSGQNFWMLIGGVILVYLVVQIIQDVLVTPHVMGKIMGLSPAVILLSLSVGGYVLGITGLIIALPCTTLGLLYYRRYIVGEKGLPA